jgi:hypothetical protein
MEDIKTASSPESGQIKTPHRISIGKLLLWSGIIIALGFWFLGGIVGVPWATPFVVGGIALVVIGLFSKRVSYEQSSGQQPATLATTRHLVLLVGILGIGFLDLPYSLILPVIIFLLLSQNRFQKIGYWLAWLLVALQVVAVFVRTIFQVDYVIIEFFLENFAPTAVQGWYRIAGLLNLIALIGIGWLLYLLRRPLFFGTEPPQWNPVLRNILVFAISGCIILGWLILFGASFSESLG